MLVLHGGASRQGRMMVSPTQLSVLRMIPIAKRIAKAGQGRLVVHRLLNSVRGWDHEFTPVRDVRWAIGEVRREYGALPVCLVGHSLGGRAALLAGEEEQVTSVVALNPWVYPSDDADLAGRRVLFVHGTEDRVALPQRATTVARRLAGRAEVSFISVPGARHAMLRHGPTFEKAAAQWAVATMLGDQVGEPVSRVLGGETWVQA